jgi:FMN phosphatase YigB (HAD superfamily)
MRKTKIKCITFDLNGTLITCNSRVDEVYRSNALNLGLKVNFKYLSCYFLYKKNI